ncbi:glycosyltransferase involved in cell wall biosynthesis [Kineococcus rhizosphaerae]|uniref:Glycosyltransferase involved in cell wall biosynthesis n=1 Tax=Kineococcus rhizosphaerae TaxID=559628 RepID=A0A2T0R5H6_9ACTN|nr:glycosyltransferase involved in cell wall biosynthesis [Kineococcus rhizosphaerae]
MGDVSSGQRTTAWVVAKQLPATTDSGGRQRTRAVIDAYAAVFDEVHVVGFGAWPQRDTQLPAHVRVHEVASPAPRPGAVLRGSVFAGKWFSPQIQRMLSVGVRAGDVVHVDFPQMAVNVPADVQVDVLDLHNIESDLLERRLRSEHPRLRPALALEVARFRRFEFAQARRARRVTACSRRDQEVLAAAGVDSTFVPNGVLTGASADPVPLRGEGRVLFVGAMDYGPNKASLRWFLDEVWPLVLRRVPDARFDVVGRGLAASHPRPAGEPAGVEFHSDVAAVDPFYDAADICVVPLLSGGGTKIKLVEALSRGRAVVSTSLGLEGLEEHAAAVRTADGAEPFADALVDLLQNPAQVRALAAAGAEVGRGFSWESAMTPLRDLLFTIRS